MANEAPMDWLHRALGRYLGVDYIDPDLYWSLLGCFDR
jgi:hypothetical protein